MIKVEDLRFKMRSNKLLYEVVTVQSIDDRSFESIAVNFRFLENNL